MRLETQRAWVQILRPFSDAATLVLAVTLLTGHGYRGPEGVNWGEWGLHYLGCLRLVLTLRQVVQTEAQDVMGREVKHLKNWVDNRLWRA